MAPNVMGMRTTDSEGYTLVRLKLFVSYNKWTKRWHLYDRDLNSGKLFSRLGSYASLSDAMDSAHNSGLFAMKGG